MKTELASSRHERRLPSRANGTNGRTALPADATVVARPPTSPPAERVAARRRIRRSLRLATLEGVAATAVLGIIQNFLIPCALALKATAFQVGLLGALPNLSAALAQLKAPTLVERLGSAKRVLLLSVGLGVLPWLALAAVPLLDGPQAVWWLLGAAVVAVVLYHLPNAAWGDWVSHLISYRRRGKYLGKRSSIASVATLGVFLGGGWLLDLLSARVLLGFAIIFGVAAAARAVSLALFAGMYEPPAPGRRAVPQGFLAFLREAPRSNMGHFLLYYGALMLAVSVSGPFFTVYMLQDLGLSYTTYMGIIVVPSLVNIVALRFWGPFADRRGNLAVLRWVTWGIALIPALWTLSTAVPWMYAVQLAGSIAWAGFSLASLNFVYEASTDDTRASNIAYLYVFNGVAIFLGNLLGGILATHLPTVAGHSLYSLFLLSTALRLLASLVLWTQVKEVRPHTAVPRPHWGHFHLHFHLPHHTGHRPR